MSQPDKVIVTKDALMKIAEEVIDLVIRKNADYGDAWQRFGVFTPLIRLNDKLLRVQTLSSGQTSLVPEEGIKDTIKDIFGYALLLLLRMKYEESLYRSRIVMAESVTPVQLPLPKVFNPEFILTSLEDAEDNDNAE